MPKTKQEATPQAAVVLFLDGSRGVYEVQVHAASRGAEAEGVRLYELLRPLVDRLDRAARGSGR